MQEILASYLFQYKTCPLPGAGTLKLLKTDAEIFVTEKKITAPVEYIIFTKEEQDAADAEEYLSVQTGVSKLEASYQLSRFAGDIKNLAAGDSISFTNAGSFSKNDDGEIQFLPAENANKFQQEIFAERVIHPHESHAILVGDTETTNTIMNEYYAEDTPVAKSRWWIFAVAIAVLSAVLIIYYFNDASSNNNFGILIKNNTPSAPKTYLQLPR